MIFCLKLWVNRMEQTCQRWSKYAINSSSAMEIQSAKMLQWYPVTSDQNRINFDARWSGPFMYMYAIVYQTLRSWILNHEYADFSFGFLWGCSDCCCWWLDDLRELTSHDKAVIRYHLGVERSPGRFIYLFGKLKTIIYTYLHNST